jgi:hypothetical protein
MYQKNMKSPLVEKLSKFHDKYSGKEIEKLKQGKLIVE